MAEGDRLALDTSQWPLAIVRMPRGSVTDAEIEAFFEAHRAMIQRGERYVQLADARHSPAFPAAQRRRMAEFLKEVDEAGRRQCAGLALVIDSALLRGGLTAILWIFQPTFPMKVVGTLEEAVDYLTSAAAKAGIALQKGTRERLLSLSRIA